MYSFTSYNPCIIELSNAIADAIINYKNNTRINLEDAASSREIVTATKTEETTPNEISAAMETEAIPVPEVNDQVTKNEIKEPIAIVAAALPETETAEATPEKPAEGLTKEEVKPQPKSEEVVKEEVIEEPVKVVEEPIATPIVDKKKEEVVKEEEIKKEEVVSDTKVVFKVQLLASSKVLPLLSEEFNGLSTLSTERHKN
ncbi:N-acetylmuramoyl-L-alanine amidase, partial [bacterium]|nr:N-acetylmuramoyl-L-alanine amidase [bacterium]